MPMLWAATADHLVGLPHPHRYPITSPLPAVSPRLERAPL